LPYYYIIIIIINQGVRQGFSLSSILFSIYTDEILQEWNKATHLGIGLTHNPESMYKLCYAYDQVVLATSEGGLQKLV
jgi:hypothetical protein